MSDPASDGRRNALYNLFTYLGLGERVVMSSEGRQDAEYGYRRDMNIEL